MTFGHSPSLIRKVLGIDPKNVIHRACVYNVGLHNDNVPKHLALQLDQCSDYRFLENLLNLFQMLLHSLAKVKQENGIAQLMDQANLSVEAAGSAMMFVPHITRARYLTEVSI